MIDKETIQKLKQDHPEFFAARVAIFPGERGEQQIAQVLLQQIEHDKSHPPEAERVAKVRRAIVHVNAKGAELERLRVQVGEQLRALGDDAAKLDVEILSISDAVDTSGMDKLVDEHREFIARQKERIEELEGFLAEQGEALAVAQERVKQVEDERDQVLGDLDALKGVNETHRIKLEKAEQELKAAQEAAAKAAKKK